MSQNASLVRERHGGALHHGHLSSYKPSAEDLEQPPTADPDSIPTWVAGWSVSAGEATAQLIWRLTDRLSTQVSDLDDDGVQEHIEFIHTFELPGLEEMDIKRHIDKRRGTSSRTSCAAS